MRREPLGKVVKKWLMQGKSVHFVAGLLKKPVKECEEAYINYMRGYKTLSTPNLKHHILNKNKIHIYGDTGVGKSFLVKKTIERINTINFGKQKRENLRDCGRQTPLQEVETSADSNNKLSVVFSYARLEEDIIRDFGEYIFQENVNTVFVFEADNFYWRKYSLIKKIVKESPNCFIIITKSKTKPNANVAKLMKQIKIQPPSKSQVLEYIKSIDPDWSGDVSKIYDPDWRIVLRRLKFGKTSEVKVKKLEKIDSKLLAYKIIRGKATLKDFERCKDPDSWVINWLGWNANSFWSGTKLMRNLSIISWCDANKYNFKKDYIRNTLLQIVPTFVKGFLQFPPFKKTDKKNEKEQAKTIIREHKKTKQKKTKPKKPKAEYKDLSEELGDFLMI